MQPNSPWPATARHPRQRVLAVVALVLMGITLVALGAFVWYPATQQPQVTLTNASVVSEACASVPGGFTNKFDWTFTLVNTGGADGDAAIGFVLGGYSAGFVHYLVPQHSQLTETKSTFGLVYPSSAACPAPESPGLSLASVTRVPPIDPGMLIQVGVRPAATLAFTGIMLGVLQWVARRRGFSIFWDLGGSGVAVAILTVFAAGFFANVVTLVLTTPYNYPPDWTPALVGGYGYAAVGILLFALACRETIREGRRRHLAVLQQRGV